MIRITVRVFCLEIHIERPLPINHNFIAREASEVMSELLRLLIADVPMERCYGGSADRQDTRSSGSWNFRCCHACQLFSACG